MDLVLARRQALVYAHLLRWPGVAYLVRHLLGLLAEVSWQGISPLDHLQSIPAP